MGYVSSLFARCYGYLRPKTNWGICLYDPKFSYFYTNKILAEVENTLPCFELPLFPVCIERRAGFTASRIRNHESCRYVAPWLMVKGCIAIFWIFYILNCQDSVSRPLVNPCRRRSRFRQSASSRFCPALTRLRFMAIEFGRRWCPRFQASYLPACPPHLAAERLP